MDELIKYILGPELGVDTVFRWVITILSLSIALYLSKKYATEKSQDKIINIQREQLKLLDEDNKRLKEKVHICELHVIESQKELEILKARTDLTAIITLIHDATTASAEKYDHVITEMSTGIRKLVNALASDKRRGSREN